MVNWMLKKCGFIFLWGCIGVLFGREGGGGQGVVVGCVSSACPEHRMRCPKALRLLSGQRLPASCSPVAVPNI